MIFELDYPRGVFWGIFPFASEIIRAFSLQDALFRSDI